MNLLIVLRPEVLPVFAAHLLAHAAWHGGQCCGHTGKQGLCGQAGCRRLPCDQVLDLPGRGTRSRGWGHCRPRLAASRAPVPAPRRASVRVHLLPGSAGGGQSWHTDAIPHRGSIWTTSPAGLCFIQGGLGERPPGICWAGAREGTPAGTGTPAWTATLCCQQQRGCLSHCVCPPREPGCLHNALKFGAILSLLMCCLMSCAFSPSGHSFSLFGCLQFGLERKTRHWGVHSPVSLSSDLLCPHREQSPPQL